jgi:hypothetical protein
VGGSGPGTGPGERRGGGEHADTGGDGREAAVADRVAGAVDRVAGAADRVAAAVAELYGGEPEAFTERRRALVAEAKTAGDKSAVTAIAALRKPTRAAWVVNRLARAEPDAAARLAALAAALRDAEQEKDGARLRELSAERGALIDALTARALVAAGVAEAPASLRDEVADTLTAALADPATAAEFAAGRLTKAAHWSGFGLADLTPASFGSADLSQVSSADPDGTVSPADGSGSESTRTSTAGRLGSDAAARQAVPSQGRPSSPSPSSPRTRSTRPSRPSRPVGATRREQDDSPPRAERRASGPADEVAARRAAQQQRAGEEDRRAAEERRAAELQEQLAREAAEREAVRRKNYEDVERTVVSAATASAEAGLAEDRLAAEVRDLEGRLIQARANLAKARLRARQAEAAERRARQALDRLPQPFAGE